jgi:mRNA-degrading endonuclease RelE of RelBE toxin-antitoxin system
LAVAPSAERALARLPEKVATAIVEFLVGPLLDEPQKIGRPLRGELDGLWVARRGAYRIVFELDDPKRTVQVLRIDHRADVYR